jgi:DNA-binding XRE family transcriptional regulator
MEMHSKLIRLKEIREIYYAHLKSCQNDAPEYFKEIRDEFNFSQAALAERLGYTDTYICHIEKGSLFAGADILIKLGEIMGNSPKEDYDTSRS